MGEQKQKKIIALKKAKSLIETITKMVEDDRYCVDIMQQNLAVIGLLKSFHSLMMENHLDSCFKKAINSGSTKQKEKMVKEILSVNNLLNR